MSLTDFFKQCGYSYEFYFFDVKEKLKCFENLDENALIKTDMKRLLGIDEGTEITQIENVNEIKCVWCELFGKDLKDFYDTTICKLRIVRKPKIRWHEDGS